MNDAESEIVKALRASLKETARLRARVTELTGAKSEPVAIVSMACRMPGGVESPEDLWQLIAEGRTAVTEFPADRGWDIDTLYHPDPDHKGTSYVRVGGFLDGAAEFDAGFFGVGPREALAMDPQQRVMLELSWELLERAGIDPQSLRGSATGVFTGVIAQAYGSQANPPADLEGYLGTGSTSSVVSGRVAYALGLEGQAVSVDTACSSSLVALHQAVGALRRGECDLAIAGGITIMAGPGLFVEFSRQRGLSRDGYCRAFAAAADGTGFSEGAGLVLIERLSDAHRHGHPVLAVIRGSAVNQDGASNGLRAPNGPAQQRVIRRALADAGVSPAEIDLVEAHGTGTTLGDPIEAQALLATYGQGREPDRPLWLGSAKSNIGHTQAAAGVAGVIKTVLALRHGLMPASLHVDAPTPHVDWSTGGVALLIESRRWSADDHLRRAGVSAFGISGTNAHVVLEEAPSTTAATMSTGRDHLTEVSSIPWVISAKTEAALIAQAAQLLTHLERRPQQRPADVGYSLATSRATFEHRAVVVGPDRDHLLAGLSALASGESAPGVLRGHTATVGKTVFVFPGQGAQWRGMGIELWDSSRVFRDSMEECAKAFAEFVDWSLIAVLREADGAPGLDQVDVVQPALFAIMVSLAAVYRSWGVEPDAVVGHSQGEIAAAYVAGALSLRDAARVVCLRARALTELAGSGGMASIGATEATVDARLADGDGRVGIAAVNGPTSVVVSGDRAALAEFAAACDADGVAVREIPVDYASHSAHVEVLRERLADEFSGIEPSDVTVDFYSATTGELIDGTELGAAYWYRNLRSPVLFDTAVTKLVEDDHTTFVEMSPHPVLVASVQQRLEAAGRENCAVVGGVLRRNEGGMTRLLASIAELFVGGVDVGWASVLADHDPELVELPTYAFQRERYWLAGSTTGVGDAGGFGLESTRHPLVGAAMPDPESGGVVLTGRISTATLGWLAEHTVAGSVLFPGTGFVELAIRAGDEVGCSVVRELTLRAPLIIPATGSTRLQVRVRRGDEADVRMVTIYSRAEAADAEWHIHAEGVLVAESAIESEPVMSAWPPDDAVELELDGLYERLAQQGYRYGPAFQGLRRAWRSGGDICAEITLPDPAGSAVDYGIHPALLDAALHALGATGQLVDPETGYVRVPFTWQDVWLQAAGATSVRARLVPAGLDRLSIHLYDADGHPVLTVGSVVSRALPTGQPTTGLRRLPELTWTPLRTTEAKDPTALVVVDWSDRDRLAAAPDVVVLELDRIVLDGAAPADVYASTGHALTAVQSWLADDSHRTARLLVVTRGAVALPGEQLTDLAGAAAWGLLRSAQTEHPGRLVLLDIDTPTVATHVAALALGDEPQLLLRSGQPLVARLSREADSGLTVPDTKHWRLAVTERGNLNGLALLDNPDTAEPLEPGRVRIAVRGAGVNFRDALVSLDVVPDAHALLGGEAAGVVSEVGPGVDDIAVGDRVMGVVAGAMSSVGVTDHRLIVRMPVGWSFAEAAGVPLVFSTAYYALTRLVDTRPGQRILIHAAAGGVGMAAIQLARHLGLEVYATASPGKWAVLRRLGVDEERLANSRTLDFEDRFRAATGGQGMDVVLHCLTGDFTDASLRLLGHGGCLLDMGKTDVRDADAVARQYPGATYRAFDLAGVGTEDMQCMLAELMVLFDAGVLRPLPVTAWDIRRAPEALRFVSQARHTGKIVLTVPAPIDPVGTVLITGGTGTLGAHIARHLVVEHQVGHLLLVSRGGPASPGAADLISELTGRGAQVTVVACDVADRAALAELIAGIPARRRLIGVVHAAGVLDDAVFTALTVAQLRTVGRAKIDAATHLHELTRHHDLAFFAMFSSVAATVGAPGQANYAAANAYLDALAIHRHRRGLPATSLAWGLWEQSSGMTAHLGTVDRARLDRAGLPPVTTAQALAMFDTAISGTQPFVLTAAFDIATIRTRYAADTMPPMFRHLSGPVRRRAAEAAALVTTGAGLAAHLRGLPEPERRQYLDELVRTQAATVLGYATSDALDIERPFQDLGFDSLTAVELRNCLKTITGLPLPTTLVFDYPTPAELAIYLRQQITGDQASATAVMATSTRRVDEPIAIVAMACRLPGGVNSPEEFWELISEGRDAVGDFPADRGWDPARLYNADPSHKGTSYVWQGGFLHGAADFDADFFGIGEREALAMDPQQRVMLELSWELLERAGIDPRSLRGSATGVFTGVIGQDYGRHANQDVEGYQLTGVATSVVSGRVSYVLGLEGPAISVDTACSSSLVAIHQAAQSLRLGECDLALAGGITIMATPALFIEFSRQRGLSKDGRCRAFAAAADGTGFSEGAGLVLLERLTDAQRLDHPILAVIRGSAINQDGASNGLRAPSGPAQQRVIRRALDHAGFTPGDIDLVEAHGTGTTLGDPIEAQALLETYGRERDPHRPLWLGSVKSNIGHSQAAAGVAGVIKTVLALRHRVMPPTLHIDAPTPHVDWSTGNISLLTEAKPWTADTRARLAAVSAFGISGTNAHIVLEQAPPPAPTSSSGSDHPSTDSTVSWVLSAATPEALTNQATNLLAHLRRHPELDPIDVGYTLATGRADFGHRAVIVGSDRVRLLAGLAALARDEPAPELLRGPDAESFLAENHVHAAYRQARGQRTDLPPYAFQRRRYWLK